MMRRLTNSLKLFSWVWRPNLWTRLVVLLTIGFALLLGVFALISLRVLDDSTQRILDERQVIAEIAAERYDELLNQAYYELDQAAQFATFDPARPDLINENKMLANTYGRLGSFSIGVVFLDTKGRVVLAEPNSGDLIGKDYSAFPFIKQTIQTEQRNVSNPFRDPRSGKPTVAVTVPIFDSSHNLLSLLSGWIDLTSPAMQTAVQQARKIGETGHAELFDENGTVIASTESQGQALTQVDHLEFYLRMLAINRPGVEDVPVDSGAQMGEMHVMAFAPLSITHWGIAVGGTEAETFAPVRQLQSDIFIFGAFSFIIIFLATLWVASTLVRPIKALTDASVRIAHGDLASPVRLYESGEIGTLAESFETMRVRLQQSHNEITAWSNQLETRVKERTQQLETLNAELHRQEIERKQLLDRVMTAQEDERKRVARELHDETGQALTALVLALETIEASLPDDSPALRESLLRAKTLTQNALLELRAIIHDLRPSALDDLGLVPAIRRYATERLEPFDVKVVIETSALSTERLRPEVETVLFRVMQEAVNNIAQHTNACNVQIQIGVKDGVIIARIIDDGEGFDPTASQTRWGLVGMRERAQSVGGKIEWHSARGRATQVEIHIPLKQG